jgi:hypothetical protein
MTILKVTILVCSATRNMLSLKFYSPIMTRSDSNTVTECLTASSFLSDSKETSVIGRWLENCFRKSNELHLLLSFFLSFYVVRTIALLTSFGFPYYLQMHWGKVFGEMPFTGTVYYVQESHATFTHSGCGVRHCRCCNRM